METINEEDCSKEAPKRALNCHDGGKTLQMKPQRNSQINSYFPNYLSETNIRVLVLNYEVDLAICLTKC